MPEIKKGAQLAGRYSLERRLGGGGEATTWLARDRKTSAGVVLKIANDAPGAATRLREEWQANLRLLHAHIVRVFEFHDDEGLAFYSMQFVDGQDIGALAGRSLEHILPPVGLVAEALRYAHGKGIVHRDIKASNILLDRNGAPYLCDFGVSAAAGSSAAGGALIAASPQSLAGEPAAASDDIFALGGLIYELVSGAPPYSSDRTEEDLRARVPDPLRAADGSAVPPAIASLVAAMLDKDASVRPDAGAVVAALRESGFAPGTSGIRIATAAQPVEERIETVRAVPRQAAAPGADAAGRAATGLSPRTVGIALGVLVAVLIGVIFILPDSVRHEPGETEVERQGAEGARLDGRDDGTAVAPGDDEARRRGRVTRDIQPETRGLDGEAIEFNENEADFSRLSADEKARSRAETILGELLSSFETLNARAVQRWAPVPFRRAQEFYAEGDDAYLRKNYTRAEEKYLDALTEIEPLFERVEPEFQKALAGAQAAFEAGDGVEALALYELAVAITPNDAVARAGFERARNLDTVLRLVKQALDDEEDLELDAAEAGFRKAVELDPAWQPAQDGLARVQATRTKLEFDTRMSEGFEALASGDFLGARAAFRMAERLIPESREPSDGLLQVDEGLRMQSLVTLEQEARALEAAEDWEAAATTYEAILDVDANLVLAKDGLAEARRMAALHEQLDDYIRDPDRLSSPSIMQKATTLVVDITRMGDIGPRLAGQRDELSRLLKRAVTPVTVSLISDNMTSVSVYKVGNLGNFEERTLDLRPGTYVAVGVRPGFRDVRLEFRVAPEIDLQPVVVRCEEPI